LPLSLRTDGGALFSRQPPVRTRTPRSPPCLAKIFFFSRLGKHVKMQLNLRVQSKGLKQDLYMVEGEERCVDSREGFTHMPASQYGTENKVSDPIPSLPFHGAFDRGEKPACGRVVVWGDTPAVIMCPSHVRQCLKHQSRVRNFI